MSTTETIMVPVEVETHPIYDQLMAELSLDPFDDMQLVEVEVDGEKLIIDAMDRTPPPAWAWIIEDPLDDPENQTVKGMLTVLAARQAPSWGTTSTGLFKMLSGLLEFEDKTGPMALPAGTVPAAEDPWADTSETSLMRTVAIQNTPEMTLVVPTERAENLTDATIAGPPVNLGGQAWRNHHKPFDPINDKTLLGLKDEDPDVR